LIAQPAVAIGAVRDVTDGKYPECNATALLDHPKEIDFAQSKALIRHQTRIARGRRRCLIATLMQRVSGNKIVIQQRIPMRHKMRHHKLSSLIRDPRVIFQYILNYPKKISAAKHWSTTMSLGSRIQ
jgi:hypothetical protein